MERITSKDEFVDKEKRAVKGYLYIANGRVVPKEQELSLEPIKTGSFEAPSIYAANKLGMKLYMGINRVYAESLKGVDYNITFYNQHIYRSIFGIKDIAIGYKNLCKFLKTHPNIEVIHCNTPIGGVLGRICGNKYNKKVIYTAHGFHFYKGAPLANRTIFKWIEKWLAHYTDALITINKEDYQAAKKMHLKKGGKVFYVAGVGVDIHSFDNIIIDKKSKFSELKLPESAKVGIVVGDLNDNKNVETLINALPYTPHDFHMIICGFGPNEKALRKMAENLNVADRAHFLGFRKDVKELYAISDMFLFASKREGLPRSTMEAMCMGLPCVVSKIRGNVDLIDDGLGGYLLDPINPKDFAVAINRLLENNVHAKLLGEHNKEKVKLFSIDVVKEQMIDVFNEIIYGKH